MLIAPGQVTEDTPSAPFSFHGALLLMREGGWIVSILPGTHIKGQCALPGLLEQEF